MQVKNRLPFMIYDIFLAIQRCSFITSLAYLVFLITFSDGTPGSQTVTEEFSLGWPQVLCSTHGVALAWVDGRSGVGRGQKAVAVDPRKLGSLRVKDYLGVVESVKFYCTIVLNSFKTTKLTNVILPQVVNAASLR